MVTTDAQKRIIFIGGPTASGKTAVGVQVAQRLGAEIVSCDSMQVYQDVRIASNKPSRQELEAVAHHMIDMVPLTEGFDAAQFERGARQAIDDIQQRGQPVVVVGGTGMYMKVLLDGIFADHSGDPLIVGQLQADLERHGSAVLHEQLTAVDPEAARKIHVNDARRIMRALEVYHATGMPISRLQQQTQGLWGRKGVFVFGLDMNREDLYHRIEDRVEMMFREGLVQEIQSLSEISLSRTAQAIIGIKEVRRYLLGEWTLDQAKEEMKKNTRRLAKRQMTWFRAERRLQWIPISRGQGAGSAAQRIMEEVERNDGASQGER